jgi:peroxiredoxin Q/BCP
MILKDVVRIVLGRGRGEMRNVDDTAPAFAVRDHTGAMRRLSDYGGKTVVLWFYPKADTPG